MAENFNLNKYIKETKLKDGAIDTLMATFKTYGTQEVVKTLDKNFKGEKDEQKKVAWTLGTILTLYGIFKSMMSSGNKRGKLNKETDYSNFGGLKHSIYGGFSQITYLDWFKANDVMKEKKLEELLLDQRYFSEIRSGSYKTYYLPNKDYKYLIKKDGKELKIYDGEDKRAYFLYSESFSDPEKTKKFPEFGEWEFVYGFDHKKIYEQMSSNLIKKKALHNVMEGDSQRGNYPDWRTSINEVNCDFQAAVFKHTQTQKVMIAYRGTDPSHWEDWVLTNFKIGTKGIPDALTCAVWVYEKVATDPKLIDYEIHVTGHSMGGALTQYIAVYGFVPTTPTIYEEYDVQGKKELPMTRPVYKAVTFNGLGIAEQYKCVKNNDRDKHYQVYKKNFFPFMNTENKVLNFYFQFDGVSDIQIGVGTSVMIDTVDVPDIPSGAKFLGNDMANYHSVSSFIPYIHNGNIVRNKPTNNFIMNAIKQTVLKEKNEDIKTLFGSKKGNENESNTFKEKITKKTWNFTDKEFNEIKPEVSNYLEDFNICELTDETYFGNVYDSFIDKKESKGNIFYYMMEYNYDKNKTDWYTFNNKDKVAEIGRFNNMSNIAGVEGGLPLRILLPEEVTISPKDLERRKQNFLLNRLKNDSIEGFNFIGYRKFIMTQEIGRHNAFVIEGRVKEEDYDKYIKNEYYGKEICVKPFNVGENNEDVITDVLIKGIINRIELKKETPVDYFVKINAVSSSYLMDKIPKNRTFTNKEVKYEDIFGEFQELYEDINLLNKEDSKIQKYFLQYRETDWQFLKRVCSNLGKPVIVDRFISENQQIINIGYFDEVGNTESVYGYEDKLVSKMLEGKTVIELDKIMKVGAYVNLKKTENQEEKKEEKEAEEKENSNETDERPQYFIKRVEAKLENEVINFYYTLVPNTKEEKLINPSFNKKLAKKTLLAQVIGVKNVNNLTEEIKINNNLISLNFDISYIEDFENSKTNNNKLEESYLFPFVTEYSGGGSGSFSCPNLGEKVMIHYPNENEHEGIIVCGKKEVYYENLHKPENKSWGNATGQGYIANENEGLSIYGNSITNHAESTSFANFKKDSIEFASNKKDVNIFINKLDINLVTGSSGIDLKDDSIIFKCGGKETKIDKNSIEGFDGTLKINDTEITSNVKIINV